MRTICSVPIRVWDMARERMASSETTPPALRITWASPGSSPRSPAGSSRESMQARIASLRAGARGRSPLSKVGTEAALLSRRSRRCFKWGLCGARMAKQGPVIGDLVGPDALERGRVRMEGGGGLGADVSHAMNGLAGDGDGVAVAERVLHRSCDRKPFLGDRAVDDRDRCRAVIVVVETRVVPGHPADEVDLDRVVAVEELVDALGWIVLDQGPPGVRAVGPGLEDCLEVGGGELLLRRAHAEISRAAGTQV